MNDKFKFLESTILKIQRKDPLVDEDLKSLGDLLIEMGVSEKRELKSMVVVILTHLIKIDIQPSLVSKSWILSIVESRNQISDLFDESPSLIKIVDSEFIKKCYSRAANVAEIETGLRAPKECEYNWSDIMEREVSK